MPPNCIPLYYMHSATLGPNATAREKLRQKYDKLRIGAGDSFVHRKLLRDGSFNDARTGSPFATAPS